MGACGDGGEGPLELQAVKERMATSKAEVARQGRGQGREGSRLRGRVILAFVTRVIVCLELAFNSTCLLIFTSTSPESRLRSESSVGDSLSLSLARACAQLVSAYSLSCGMSRMRSLSSLPLPLFAIAPVLPRRLAGCVILSRRRAFEGPGMYSSCVVMSRANVSLGAGACVLHFCSSSRGGVTQFVR